MSLYRAGDGLWRSRLLDSLGEFEHAFGTAHARPPGEWRVLHQRHTAHVVDAAEAGDSTVGDGLITNEPGVGVAVKTADCIPLLIADPVRGVAAAVHAGWRGAIRNIAAAALQALRDRHGCAPQDLHAALGPSIRACCFEVGPEVAVRFKRIFPERTDLGRRTHIDLPEALRRQLAACGLSGGRISTEAPCTVCGGGEFHSWRRDRIEGARMYSAIRRRPAQ